MRVPVIQIDPGTYSLGDDFVADAKPKHKRRIDAPFWIERDPVPVDAFSKFVANSGYDRPELWLESGPIVPLSVDCRCEEVFRASTQAFGRQRIVTGLTWFEAAALARFARARLPFEVEWEIAVAQAGHKVRVDDGLVEWTADAFSPCYWRADYSRRGVSWSNSQRCVNVSVRGRSVDAMFQHVCARKGRDPKIGSPVCGFRRVWDVLPPDDTSL